jgi:hypothetical protein
MTTSLGDLGRGGPGRFYALATLLRSMTKGQRRTVANITDQLEEMAYSLRLEVETLVRANNQFLAEVRNTQRREKTHFAFGEKSGMEDLEHTTSRQNLLGVAFDLADLLGVAFATTLDLARALQPGDLLLPERQHMDEPLRQLEDLGTFQRLAFEVQLNGPTVEVWASALASLGTCKASEVAEQCQHRLEAYHRALVRRHSVEGVEIHGDPLLTDIAISIYENVDAHGEIEAGRRPDEVSAYSMRKAEVLASAVTQDGLLRRFLEKPSAFIHFLSETLRALHDALHELRDTLAEQRKKLPQASGNRSFAVKPDDDGLRLEGVLALIQDLDPRGVIAREPEGLLTAEERFLLQFRNQTLSRLTFMLRSAVPPRELVDYVLSRKAELRVHLQEENSFYVCRIGHGNMFQGVPPGELEVIPAERPVVDLSEIAGSGFDEVREHLLGIQAAEALHDLFVATSPSRSSGKDNVLLVGPPGCGKSELLRAVGADRTSIAVSAQGSDFLTCWKGEAEKNPKRLFEAGMRLQRQSHRHVHFLIDEIDAVLNNDREHGSTNLTLEFQILMDGIVQYPGLSVWGATNALGRIPLPMIRRFAKVLIVGELSQQDRVRLLRHFVSFLPLKGWKDKDWEKAATRLEGATGDVLRKIADHVWREKVGGFAREKPTEAKALVAALNDGERFMIGAFTAQRREAFQAQLSPHVQVTPADVTKAVDLALDDVAVHHEIEAAKASYANAHEFLAQLRRRRTPELAVDAKA